MKEHDAPTSDTQTPSTDPTPAGDVSTLRELAEDEGGTVDPDEVPDLPIDD